MLSRLNTLRLDFDGSWADLWATYKARLALFSWLSIGVGVVVVVAVFVLTACGLPSPTQYQTPGGTPFATPIKTLPTSRHVTGLPYPSQCTLGGSAGKWTPDKSCTPGSAEDEVQAPTLGNPGNLKGTICTPGWTAAARALDKELVPVRDAATTAYNVRGQAVLDYLVPLNLGGSNDVSNMWVMPIEMGNPKTRVELALNKAVCAGTISLGSAQNAIATDWTKALKQLGLGG